MLEVTLVYYNKVNIQLGFNTRDRAPLEKLAYLVNINLESKGTRVYIIEGYSDKKKKKLDHLRLSVSMKTGTVEAFVDLLNLLVGVFCANDFNVDCSIREILTLFYIEYCEKHLESQECYIPEPVNECGCCLTIWDPTEVKYKAWVVSQELFSNTRKLLRKAWKTAKESDVCVPFSLWDGKGIGIIPSYNATERHCEGLKGLLNQMTSYNPNWTVDCKTFNYRRKAYCYLKCDNQEQADKVFKKVSKLNRQVAKTINKNGHDLFFNTKAEIVIGKMSPDEKSIYVIIKDDFVVGQIQLSEFGIQCKNCHNNKEQMFKCSKCQKEYYCSRECQVKDWPTHKKDCKKEAVKTTE